MTHAVSNAPAGLRRPADYLAAETIRVAVLFGDQQDDFTVPVKGSSALVAAGLAREIMEARSGEEGIDEDALIGILGMERLASGRPISPQESLADAGVVDGDVLILTAESGAPAFSRVTEMGSTAVAQANAARFQTVDEDTAISVSCWFLAAATVFAIGLGINAWRLQLAAGHDADWRPGAGLLTLALLLGIGAVGLGWRFPRQRRVAATLYGGALAAASVGAALVVPGQPAAANVVLGAAVAAVGGALLWWKAPAGRGIAASVALVGAGLTIGALVRMLLEVRLPAIMVGSALLGMVLVTFAPKVAALAAGLRPPPFPTITGKLLFETSPQLPENAMVPMDTVNSRPTTADQVSRANDANTYLTATIAASAIFVVAGCWGLITPADGRWWIQSIFVGVLSVVWLLRGRAFAARAQAIIVVSAALLAPAGAAARFAATSVTVSGAVAAGALAICVLGAIVAVWVPVHEFAPTERRWLVFIEYGLIALLVPLSWWIMNVYTAVRHS
ncbi:type VII secretion integral membrane protein EccD [Mycobacteroides franklinii]|nr:type VII secretion integral membrane protein EccD [Mycobacteroides franklinii]ORA60897.1 type VII secretion integral membrane protein EccD [Mycobacteroides franklinii]